MSDRKRSRKAKLIPRTEEYLNYDETHNVLGPNTSDKMESTPNMKEPPQFDVMIKVETCDDESESINFFAPQTTNVAEESRQIKQYLLDNNEVTDKIDSEFSYSLPLADQLLYIAIRNNLGNSLKCPPRTNEDVKMDNALRAFGLWYLKCSQNVCVMYKCYMCEKSWFHLDSFHNHIKGHDFTQFEVVLETLEETCNIVAYSNQQPTPSILKSDEVCPICNKEAEIHICNIICKFCMKVFQTCQLFKLHERDCEEYKIHLKSLPQFTSMTSYTEFTCNLCNLPFFNPQEIFDHMKISHVVRSDVLCQWDNVKFCTFCSDKYLQFSHHPCLARSENVPFWICHKRFHNSYLLQIHQDLCQRNFKCRVCQKVLMTACIERIHLLEHTDNFVNVYKCSLCPNNLLCIDEYSYIKHIEIWHMKTNSRTRINDIDKLAVPISWVKDAVHYQYDSYTDALKLSSLSRSIEAEKTSTTLQTDTEHNEYSRVESQENKASRLKSVDKIEIVEVKQEIFEPDLQNFEENNEIKKESEDIDDEIARVFKPSTMLQGEVDDDIVINIKTENDHHHIYVEYNHDFNDTASNNMEDAYNTLINNAGVADKNIKEPNTPVENKEKNKTKDVTNKNEQKRCKKKKNKLPNRKQVRRVKTKCELINYIQLKNLKNHNFNNANYDDNEVGNKQTEVTSDNTKENLVIKCEPLDEDIDGLLIIDSELECNVNTVDAANLEPEIMISDQLGEIYKCKKCDFVGTYLAYAQHAPSHSSDSQSKGEYNHSIKKGIEHKEVNCDGITVTTDNIHKLDSSFDELIHMETEFGGNEDNLDSSDSESKLVIAEDDGKFYECKKCNFCGNYKEYVRHLSRHSNAPFKKSRYFCSKCQRHYSTLAKYAKHLVIHDYDDMTCPVCNMQIPAMQGFVVHLNFHIKSIFVRVHKIDENLKDSHKRQRLYECNKCKLEVDPANFFNHWENHTMNEEIPIAEEESVIPKLPGAVVVATSMSIPIPDQPLMQHVLKLLQYVKINRYNRDKFRKCIVCNRKFNRTNDCKRHLIEHLLANAYVAADHTKGLKCQICPEKFSKAETYKHHMREHGRLPIYKCYICCRMFSDSSNFTKHKKVHNLTAFTCDTCGKKFQAKKSLERHVIMHMSTHPKNCEFCDKKFYSDSTLRKHVKVVHEKVKSSIHCHICRITFSSLKAKWDHMWEFHRQRKFEADCHVCSKSYRKFMDLKRHCIEEHRILLRNVDVSVSNEDDKKSKVNVSLNNSIKFVNCNETLVVSDTMLGEKSKVTCDL